MPNSSQPKPAAKTANHRTTRATARIPRPVRAAGKTPRALPVTHHELRQATNEISDRGACLIALADFIDTAFPREVDLLDRVIKRYTDCYGNVPLELIMRKEANECDEDITNTEWQLVRALRDALRIRSGSATPAEEYVIAIVDLYRQNKTITPADLEQAGQEFMGHYKSAVANAKRLLRA